MVYNTQNYYDFGLCPSFGILETREHNVSENGSKSKSETKSKNSVILTLWLIYLKGIKFLYLSVYNVIR
jgi:hypothetical protein